jgi:DNA polymerase elongation subunit (family B)
VSLADEARASSLKRIVDRSATILTLDIETSPHLAYSFDVWGANIGPDKIMEPSRVLMMGAKWYGQRNVLMLSERLLGHEQMIEQTWALVDQADIVVHYNGRKFDMKHLRREWAQAGLPPPSPYKQVDLLLETRKLFANPSNKLDAVAKAAGIGQKMKHEGFALWAACLAGDVKAWARMERYCRQDVRLTETYYDWLRPWISTHPHITNSTVPCCNRCGSAELQRMGKDYLAVLHQYSMWRCGGCGGVVRASYTKRAATTRGVGS